MSSRAALRRRWRLRRRDEGAVAIMVAVLAVALIGIAALGVDLGNAMNRKQLTQNAADFSSLAGAESLPLTTVATAQRVADSLNQNQPAGDGVGCNPNAGSTITAAMMTDGVLANGEVTYPAGTTRVRVVSPSTRVKFGLATVLGFESTCVSSISVARIASGKIGTAPYYATDACDQGPQVLKSDAGGPSIPFSVPALSNDSETNTSVLTPVATNPNPNQIPVQAVGAPDGPTITLTGTFLGAESVDKVGFFSSDQSSPRTATPATQSAGSLTVAVPNDVARYQDVWWIRVRSKTTSKWSARAQARPLLVGDVTLSCDPESSSGNFGSIDIPWGGNDLDDLERNIRDGQRAPTTLLPWPNLASLPADNTCNTHPLGVISTDSLSRENTNCVQSVTGLKAKPAYDGLLKDPNGKLLVNTSPLCQGVPSLRPARGVHNENSDILSCFLANDTLKLSDTVNYSGTQPLFVQEIWKSPRFILVPKLHHDPSGTKWMPITGFVPGFITDQPTGASRPLPLVTGLTDNGLVVEHPDKLRAIRVFFFDIDALPLPPDGIPLQDYIGSGRKVVTLVD